MKLPNYTSQFTLYELSPPLESQAILHVIVKVMVNDVIVNLTRFF